MQQTLLKLHIKKKYSGKLTVTQECSMVSEKSRAFTSLLLCFPKSHALTELREGRCLSKHQSSLLLIRSKFTLLFETIKNAQIKHDTQTLPDHFIFFFSAALYVELAENFLLFYIPFSPFSISQHQLSENKCIAVISTSL